MGNGEITPDFENQPWCKSKVTPDKSEKMAKNANWHGIITTFFNLVTKENNIFLAFAHGTLTHFLLDLAGKITAYPG